MLGTHTISGILFGSEAETKASEPCRPLDFGKIMAEGYSEAELNAELLVLFREITEQKRRLAKMVALVKELEVEQASESEHFFYQTTDGRTRYFSLETKYARANAHLETTKSLLSRLKNAIPAMAKWIVSYIESRFKKANNGTIYPLLSQTIQRSTVYVAQTKYLSSQAKMDLLRQFGPMVEVKQEDKELVYLQGVHHTTHEFIKHRWNVTDDANELMDAITDNLLKVYVYYSPYRAKLETPFLTAQSHWDQQPYSHHVEFAIQEETARLTQQRNKQLRAITDAEQFLANRKMVREHEEKTHELQDEAEAYCQRVEQELATLQQTILKQVKSLHQMSAIATARDYLSLQQKVIEAEKMLAPLSGQYTLGGGYLKNHYAEGFANVGMSDYFEKVFVREATIQNEIKSLCVKITKAKDVLADVNTIDVVRSELLKKFLRLVQDMVSQDNLVNVWNKKLKVSRFKVNGVMVQLGISKIHAEIHDKAIQSLPLVDALAIFETIKAVVSERRSHSCFSWLREKLRDQDSTGEIYKMIDNMSSMVAEPWTAYELSQFARQINQFEVKLKQLHIQTRSQEMLQQQLPVREESIKLNS